MHQNHPIWRVLACLGLVAGCASRPLGAAEPPAAATRPALLFLGGSVTEKPLGEPDKYALRSTLPDARLQDKLAEWGYDSFTDFFSTQLTWDELRQFNAVVLLDFPIAEATPGSSDKVRHVEGLLQRYVREGGGLLLTGSTEVGMWALERNTEALNRFLEPFGATVLAEQVGEKDPALRLGRPTPQSPSELAWTGNVVAAPQTEGVRGMIYPTSHAWCYYTHPIRVSGDWQVLVKGSPTAYSFTVPLGRAEVTGEDQGAKPGTYGTEPPIVAVRTVDQGRLALWPVTSCTTIIDGYHPFNGGGMIMAGGGGPAQPSNVERLLQNLLAWLAEPSRGRFGGFKPKAAPAAEREPGLFPIDWDAFQAPARRLPNTYRGLIGLRSTLTDGSAPPAAMLAATRAAGYHFAAFAEDLARLTPEALEALKRECAAASGTDFQAFPGFTYRLATGDEMLVFGTQVSWPKDDWWHDPKAKTISQNNHIFRGYQYPPVVLLHPGTNPKPAWFHGNFKGFAVHTYDGGQLVDDATTLYQRLSADNFMLFPLAVHLVRSPAEIQTAAAGDGMQTYVQWYELPDLLNAISGHYGGTYKGNHTFQWNSFVSAGPQIEDFAVHNFGTSDLAVPGGERLKVHLRLTSERGLQDVVILDKERLWRRFRLDGVKEWDSVIDAFHGQMHDLVLRVTDTAGRTAMSAGRWTGVQEFQLVRCTDNLNTFFSGKFQAAPFFACRGLENYVDRQAGSFVALPRVEKLPETQRYAVEQRLRQVSRFGCIWDLGLGYAYPPDASANWNRNDQPLPAKPQDTLRGTATVTLFAPWADGTAVYLVEQDLEVLRDLGSDYGKFLLYQAPWITEAETVTVSRRGKPAYTAVLKPRQSWIAGPADEVEYVAQIGPFGGSRAVAPLSPGLGYLAPRGREEPARASLLLEHYPPNAPLRAGDRIRARYLALWSAMNTPPDTAFVEEVFETMGLRGRTAYAVQPRQGKVVDTAFVLRLQAEGGGFAGRITQAKLPLCLPVSISGLNDRWPAGIWYQGACTLYQPIWTMDRVHNRFAQKQPRQTIDEVVRCGSVNGTGMLQVDTETGDKDVFIGNLLVCDQPDVILELDDVRPGKGRLSANNPTDQPLTVTIRPGPGFSLLGAFAKVVTLPAGGAVAVSLE
jgi:hypothetical protein